MIKLPLYNRYLEKIFTQLEEFRAFELLRSGLDRSKYLLVMEAKIIAMTCTHAALKRQDLVDLGKFGRHLMVTADCLSEILTCNTYFLNLSKNRMQAN